MSFPNNYSWGSHSNEVSHNQRNEAPVGLNNWQQFGPNHQGTWQQQNTSATSQPPYSQQQHSGWNNNASQKSTAPPSQMNYKDDGNFSWNQPPQQSQYLQQQPLQHQQQYQYPQAQQFQGQHQFTNTSNQYSFEGVTNTLNPQHFNSGQQMNYTATNPAADPWNWGWDESSASSPAASFSTNNNISNDGNSGWNVDDNAGEHSSTYNPVQNYFQQGNNSLGAKTSKQEVKYDSGEQFRNKVNTQTNAASEYVGQNYYENEEKLGFNTGKNSEVLNVKPEVGSEGPSDSLAVSLGEVNFPSNEVNPTVDVKPESSPSIQNSSSSNVSDLKIERLSPDSNKIPLTTQALRDFCKEKYENGPIDLKSRNNAEGLTPQWSIESQVSQDTASDDISPSVQEGSHSDLSNWDSISGHHQAVESSREESSGNLNLSPKSSVPTKEPNSTSQGLEGIGAMNKKMEDCNLAENRLNQQVIPGGNLPPPPPSVMTPRPGDSSNNNMYSLSQKFPNKGPTQAKNVYPKPVVENVGGPEFKTLVKQMDKCSLSDESSNQQVVSGNPPMGSGKTPNQSSFMTDNWYTKRVGLGEESINQETIPDNEERPDAEEHRPAVGDSSRFSTISPKNSKTSSRNMPPFASGSDNQEVAPRPDRNQYLETGRLEDQLESDSANNDNDLTTESLPPPGLSRHVPGEIQPNTGVLQSNVIDISSPPPGLDRMVLGQITENEPITVSDVNSFRLNQNTPPPGLHRMIPGQLTDDQGQCSTEEASNILTNVRRDDIPPPGFHRMIPGESSSPETQNAIQMPMDPREQRVVTGVAKDEIVINPLQTNISSASPTPVNRLATQSASPEESRLQFQSERCETIGSDNVDNYGPNLGDITSAKLGKRKEGKERDRHREDISSDEAEREPPRRHDRDSDYYSKRDRNREREDSSPVERYRDERERRSKNRDWERERRKDSPGRYREDKGRRRDYREDRRRHKDYDYSDDEDGDTNGYYSDRERRNVSRYRDDYDRYSRRDDRARSLRPDKSSKDSNEERGPNKSRRRGGYGDRDRELDRDRDIDRDRDRERDRDRDRDRDRGKDRDRQSDYYRRRDDLDEFSQRSRPSSRNDSIHDYKHRSARSDYDGDRDKDHYRSHSKRDRDMFYPSGNYYDPAYYNYYYQYYENLRRTNPAAYAEWFRKYYASSQHGTFDGTYTEDRGSVHSGRSSANEENKDRRLDSSLQMEAVQRLTPAKFTTAHVKGSLTPRGQLIKILPHYPLDGQPATLEIHENLNCFDDVRKEFLNFPGPLVKGVTHKNNILRYCKQKIRDADSNPELFDKESYKLIWELLILLIRQNGTVVGTDIAELLMSNRSSHVSRSQPPVTHVGSGEGSQSTLSEEEVTNQFRDYLIYGNTKEALEWAMKHGLWGHALFLASKMDQRTYASVMTRFANGLTMNDPLQTLYQLMSGRQPASVTCCADEKWGDWRPHLAMILSNSTARPDLDLKAVTTLGDTLGARGNLHAAHFCYLMAQVEFGNFSHKSSKIVLIGSSHTLPFQQFANNEAIFATEIFEFACSLADPDFALHHLQVYKLLMAKRLCEVGLAQEAVHYVEVIANTITKFPALYPPYFIQEVYNLGNMLKYFDPVYNSSETSGSDPEWLLHLLNILNDYQTGVLQHDGMGSASNLTTYSENEGMQSLPLDPSNIQESSNESKAWQSQQQMYYEHTLQQQQQQQQQQQPLQWNPNDQSSSGYQSENKGYMPVSHPANTTSSEGGNHSYWSNQNQWMQSQSMGEGNELQQTNESEHLSGIGVEATDGNQNRSIYNYYDKNRNESSPPQLTLPGSTGHKQRTISQSSEDRKLVGSKPKPAKKEPSKHNQSSGSWFGGIWNKLPFRPKNQMILPDDKNPSIVWDSDKNRWVNLNGDEDDSGGHVPPPPKASELPSAPIPSSGFPTTSPMSPYTPNTNLGGESTEQPDASSTPTMPSSGPNKYKMTRGKNLRSNYVDVLNPGGTKAPSAPVPAPDLFPAPNYSSQLPTNYFIPAPVEGNENVSTDFLSQPTPAQPVLGRLPENVESPQQQGSSSVNDDYYKGNSQWSAGGSSGQRYPPSQNSTLPRSKGYPN